MRKICILFIAISLSIMLLSACEQRLNKANTTPLEYKVSQPTGLYSALEIDAEQVSLLSEESILVPADGQPTLFCDTFVDSGLKYALCKVEVMDTGQTGWVLQMFIEKN